MSIRLYGSAGSVSLVALASMALVVPLDLIGDLFCVRVPLLWYGVTGLAGILLGVLLRHRLGQSRRWILPAQGIVTIAVIAGVWISLTPRWDSKCAWRYCGRLLGPGLDRSPLPVGTPDCNDLHMCANEYPYAGDQFQELRELMTRRHCAPP